MSITDIYTEEDFRKERKKLHIIEEQFNTVLEEASKHHPKYPEYGYTYKDGEIIEVKRAFTVTKNH